MNCIYNNPYRILGVYAGASAKEIAANTSKLKAYLKVGKTVEFPADFIILLPVLDRSQSVLDAALAKINLPQDKIQNALFWFVKGNSIDEIALNHLQIGNKEKALQIFGHKETYSSLHNQGVLSFINEDWGEGIRCITTMLHADYYREEFVKTIAGENFQISEEDLAHLFIDSLLESIQSQELLQLFLDSGSSSDDDDYLKEKVVGEPIKIINNEIERAKTVDDKDAPRCYAAGVALISKTKKPLELIKELLDAEDIQYQHIADKLANQILQCGINYYNNSNDEDDIEKALKLQQFALSIAATKMAKDRCQQNVKILLQMKEKKSIEADVNFITTQLKGFHLKLNTIANSRLLVTSCHPKLQNIKNVLGESNDLYLKISSAVANNALGMLIEVINSGQTISTNVTNGVLDDLIKQALSVMSEIDTLDMMPSERSHFNENEKTLKGLQVQIVSVALREVFQTCKSDNSTSTSSSSDSESSVGWIVLIVVVIIVILVVVNS